MSDPIVAKNYDVILTRGLQSSLESTPIEDGKLRYCTDTGRLYMDVEENSNSKRIIISEIITGYTEEELSDLLAPLPKIYLTSDTHRMYIHTTIGWVDIASINPNATAIKNEDQYVLFCGKTDDQPFYDDDLTYNSETKNFKSKNLEATGVVKVGNMKIENIIDADLGTQTVKFSFVE